MSKALRCVTAVVWLGAVSAGLAGMWRYSMTPGPKGKASSDWPKESALAPAPAGHTLIMFVHPECPCSRASLEELALLMAHSSGRISARVVFTIPEEKTEEWRDTPLWRKAREIPRVEAVADTGGVETRRFGSECSGDTFLYSAEGRLEFHGGITSARGHSGDNAGRSALEDMANKAANSGSPVSTPVYGCPLAVPPPDSNHTDDTHSGS